jgi:hypothetical protein
MFRPLQGHHQAFFLNHVVRMLRTLLGSNHVYKMCIEMTSDKPHTVKSVYLKFLKYKTGVIRTV